MIFTLFYNVFTNFFTKLNLCKSIIYINILLICKKVNKIIEIIVKTKIIQGIINVNVFTRIYKKIYNVENQLVIKYL